MRARIASFQAAWAGLAHAAATQTNFRIELVLGSIAVAAAIWLRAPLSPILLACALVLALELVNTAVEAAVDLVSPARRETARIAKDCAAGAVLVAALGALGVGIVTLAPPLWERLFRGGI